MNWILYERAASCVKCATVRWLSEVMPAYLPSAVDQVPMTTHPQRIYQSPHCDPHGHSPIQKLSKMFVLCSQKQLEK